VAVAGGVAVLGGLAGYFNVLARVHNRLEPQREAEKAHLSLLVLPFVNSSGDAAQDYLADAITADITAELSRLKDSFVIGRGTAFSYKGKTIDIRTLAHDLDVRYVLQGTALRQGDKLHVTTQLADGATGATLFAEKFDSDLADEGELRQEVASRLAMDLNFPPVVAEVKKTRGKKKPDEVDLTLRGWAQLNQALSRENLLAAEDYFSQALILSPDDEEALAGRGRVMDELADTYPDAESERRQIAAGQDLERALQLAPKDPIALNAMAFVDLKRGDVEKALVDNQQAVDLDPNFPEALAYQGALLILNGKNPAALKMFDRALQLSPNDPKLGEILFGKCAALIRFHEYSQAVTFCAKSVAARPVWYNLSYLVVSYMIIGDLEHAARAKKQLLQMKPDFTIHASRQDIGGMSTNPDYQRESDKIDFYLKEAGLPE